MLSGWESLLGLMLSGWERYAGSDLFTNVTPNNRVMLSSIPIFEFNHVMRDRDHAAPASDVRVSEQMGKN